MNIAQPPFQPPRYLAGIAISLAVHGLLIALWQASRPPVSVAEAPRAMEVVPFRIVPAPRVERPLPLPSMPSPAPARRQAAQDARQAPTSEAPAASTPLSTPMSTTAAEPDAPPAPPSLSSADLLARSKAAVAGVDRALRQENPRRGIQAPVVTAAMKLERGIARAAELAPNKWYQAPKTEEIIDPGQYGRRRYRVTTALGTYCVTYESNHAPDGRDSMRDGIPPKRTTCEDDEQPATIQKWN